MSVNMELGIRHAVGYVSHLRIVPFFLVLVGSPLCIIVIFHQGTWSLVRNYFPSLLILAVAIEERPGQWTTSGVGNSTSLKGRLVVPPLAPPSCGLGCGTL